MKKLKEKQGITLIALVVTIIMLLILAGISISMLTGQNGILNKTEEARKETEKASALELINLAITLNKFENDNTILNNLQEINNAKVEIIYTDCYYVTINNITFTVYEDESIYYDKIQFWNGSISTDFFSGEGTEKNPYLIRNCEDMAYLANEVNNGTSYEGIYFKLIANLDFGARKDDNGLWTSSNIMPYIGIDSDTAFSGTFDGNNNHIRGIMINSNEKEKEKGIFGYSKGSIKNIIVSGESYIGTGQFTNSGLIVGTNEGSVTNCNNISNVICTWGSNTNLGILVGRNSGEIINCYNSGDIETTTQRKCYSWNKSGKCNNKKLL